jgi:hypothetical protein
VGPGGSDTTWPTDGPGKGLNKPGFSKHRIGFKSGKLENLKSFLEIDYDIWNNFCYWHFVQISMDLNRNLKSILDFEFEWNLMKSLEL